MAGACPSRQSGMGGVQGHNLNETSFAHILFATGVPGKPRPVGEELHIERVIEDMTKREVL